MAEKLEQWAGVLGYEGLYEVSDIGRIRRIGMAARDKYGRIGGGDPQGRIIKHQNLKQPTGYLVVQLHKDGKPRTHLVHVVVAEAFIGPRPDRFEVNHIDGVKTNPALTNLEYLTRCENMRHAYRIGLRVRKAVAVGETHHNAKLTMEKAREIRRRYKPGFAV